MFACFFFLIPNYIFHASLKYKNIYISFVNKDIFGEIAEKIQKNFSIIINEKYSPYFRYSILAPNAIPQGFVDGKVVSEKVLLALQLDPAEYRLGNTKVFFKAGVVGNLENMRDERLSTIISTFQAHVRAYLIRKDYKKLCDQRYAYFNWT